MKKIFFKKGFTLIELLLVVSIIIILASLVIMSVSKSRTTARDGKRKADLSQIQLALEMYKDSKGFYPHFVDAFANDTVTGVVGVVTIPNILPTTLKSYITPFPKDPINKDNYRYEVFTTNHNSATDNTKGEKGYEIRAAVEDPDNFKDFDFKNSGNNSNNNRCYYVTGGVETNNSWYNTDATKCQ